MDLREYLQGIMKNLNPKFQRERRRDVVKDVVLVVKSFHDAQLVHCDIKSKRFVSAICNFKLSHWRKTQIYDALAKIKISGEFHRVCRHVRQRREDQTYCKILLWRHLKAYTYLIIRFLA